MSVKRVFVEKKPEYAIKAGELREEIESYLDITGVTGVRVLVRYDIENISEDVYKEALGTIFSEPPVDDVFEETFPHSADDVVFSVEYLPGQFDQSFPQRRPQRSSPSVSTRWTPERHPRRSRRHL